MCSCAYPCGTRVCRERHVCISLPDLHLTHSLKMELEDGLDGGGPADGEGAAS
jgi:hypothetical protein